MKIDRTAILVLVIVFVLGWQMSASRSPVVPPPTPPVPAPLANRPVALWVIRSAKSLLWVLAFAEKKPAMQQQDQPKVDEPMKLVKAPKDGHGIIDWSEGY